MLSQNAMRSARTILLLLLFFFFFLLRPAANHLLPGDGGGSIVFSTIGRSRFDFDIYTLPTLSSSSPSDLTESKITDGKSVNFNGHFVSPSPSLLSLLPNRTSIPKLAKSLLHLVYVSERNGSPDLYYAVSDKGIRLHVPLLTASGNRKPSGRTVISMKDKPSVTSDGDYVVYVSTHEVYPSGEPGASWAAVYSTELKTGLTRRLTPTGISDFSPAVSASGTWTAVASYGERGWNGEVEELSTDIYVFLTRDGSQRVKVVEHGGWPSWVDDSTLYFHRRSKEDSWVSVYRAVLPKHGRVSTESVRVQRVTPPGLHAFTPATSPVNHDFIAVATRRPGSDYRHVELYDLKKNEFRELTRLLSPSRHHYNPFLSPDSTRVGYHRCRGRDSRKSPNLFLENIPTATPDLSLFRIDGSSPSFSPAGDRIAYFNTPFPGLFLANADGSNNREVYPGMAFSATWDPIRPGIVYISSGPILSGETTKVDILAIDVDATNPSKTIRTLTTNGQNNAFPSSSPDGKQIVYRSGLSGHKNLYIITNVEKGEAGLTRRLTEGSWTDTMCSWSPTGDWIAFASDRENPGSGRFELFLIHPNGTGLRRLIQGKSLGVANHPSFSPDGETVVFTADYGGLSGEPIGNPQQFRPYGEIFRVRLDGSGLRRLTHNAYEDGTPTWAPKFIRPDDVAWSDGHGRTDCAFDDCLWLKNMTMTP